jgi:transglutaminase/protease-like cytokinesis protein 3
MKIFFSLLLLISSCCIGQTDSMDFTLVDSRIKDIRVSSPDTLAYNLTAPYTTETEKVRSIFKWITEYIAYDTKGYYNLNNIYKGLYDRSRSLDSATAFKNYNDNIVQKVLREKVAICDGYSRLFKMLCDYAGIKSEIVTGYVRWYSDQIGEQTKRIHAWNAVQIDNRWFLLDATWASGYANTDITDFKKVYDDFYFLTPADQFINDHFPLDSTWTLLATSFSLDDFYNQPYIFPAFRKYKIKSYQPFSGLITSRKDEKIDIEIETDEPAKEMNVMASLKADTNEIAHDGPLQLTSISNLLKPKYTISGNKISYPFHINSEAIKELYVLYNGELVMRYCVKFK